MEIKSEILKNFVDTTLADNNSTILEKSTILKNVFDSEKAIADADKSIAETENARKPQPKELAKLFISTIAPLITAFVLIATFWYQINQNKINNDNQAKLNLIHIYHSQFYILQHKLL